MTSWRAAERVALTLPEAELGEAHEGSAAVFVRGKQFARLRWDGRRELLQVWVAEAGLVAAYLDEDPERYRAIPGYSKLVVLGVLELLDDATVRELLVESWTARATKRLVAAHPDLR